MRMPRMKVPAGTDGIYHCHSRVVDGKFIFGGREKEQFLRMMWHIGDFLGIQVLDYVVMSNHYHQVLFVPGIVELSNENILEHLRVYYGGETGSDQPNLLTSGKLLQKRGENSALKPVYWGNIGGLSGCMGRVWKASSLFLPRKTHSKQPYRRIIQSNSFTINNYGCSDPRTTRTNKISSWYSIPRAAFREPVLNSSLSPD